MQAVGVPDRIHGSTTTRCDITTFRGGIAFILVSQKSLLQGADGVHNPLCLVVGRAMPEDGGARLFPRPLPLLGQGLGDKSNLVLAPVTGSLRGPEANQQLSCTLCQNI